MVDWRLARLVAQGVVAAGSSVPPEAAAPFERVEEPAEESRRLVEAYTQLTPVAPVPAPQAVDRTAWISINLAGMAGVIDPVLGRVAGGLGPLGVPIRAAGGALLAAEVGTVSGVLAQRVLGQYEFPLMDPSAPARLLFVAPNLAAASRSLDAEPSDLLRWVALHEITHALQFGGVPWLRPHLAERVRGLLEALEGRSSRSLDVRAMAEAVRRGDLVTAMLSEAERAQVAGLQALMAVLEGHAEHVMDAVGAELLPRLPELRTAMDRRRRERTGFLRLFERLIGMDMKLRQYEEGKAFCDAVVARGGIEGLNRVWSGPEAIPTPAELCDPSAWLARV